MVAARAWPPREVTSAKRGLENLVLIVQSAVANKVENEILGELSRYLVIRTSGYVERCTSELFRGFVEGKSGGPVRSFAYSWLGRSKNPSPEALLSILNRFDPLMESEFSELLDADDQHLRRELSSLVSKRNAIAHGMNEGVGHERALSLTLAAEEAVDWFILRLNPH